MNKIITNIKNLFKVYGLLNDNAIVINPTRMNLEPDKWYYISIIAKAVGRESFVDDLLVFQLDTKRKAENKKDNMTKPYLK